VRAREGASEVQPSEIQVEGVDVAAGGVELVLVEEVVDVLVVGEGEDEPAFLW
jgi:hypothetical protein